MAAESFDFEMRLISSGVVTGAKQASDALSRLSDQLDNTSSEFEKALAGKSSASLDKTKESVKDFSKELQKATAEAAKLSSDPKGFQMLAKARQQMADQKKQLLGGGKDGFADEVKRAHEELKKLNSDPKGYKAMLQARKDLAKRKSGLAKEDAGFGAGLGHGLFSWATPYGGGRVGSELVGHLAAEGIIKGAEILIEGAHKVVEIIADGFKRALEKGGERQALNLGEKLSLGGESNAKEFRDDVKRFAGITGFARSQIEEMLIPLRRSGMSQQEARSSFAASVDVAAGKGRGGDPAEVEKYVKAFESLRLRGNIEIEQLAGLGIDVHKYYKAVAKATGTDEKTARIHMTEGKVNRTVLLNELYKGIEREQGGKLGTGGIAYSQTMQARLNKLQTLPDQFFAAMAESPRWNELSDRIGGLLSELDPDSEHGKKILDSMFNAFGELADLSKRVFTPENIEGFVQGLTKVVDLAASFAKLMGPVIDAALFLSNNSKEIGEYLKVIDPLGEAARGTVGVAYDSGKALFGSNNASPSPTTKNPSAALAGGGSFSAPVSVTVQVNGGVDPNTAKQVGQTVGDEAGREASKHIGRIAQEAGAM